MNEAKRQRRIEMGAFWVGLTVVVGMLGALFWLERPGQPEVALLAAEISRVDREGDRMIVRFTVTNYGSIAVENVIVRIGTPRDETTIDQVLAYLPVGMSRRGVATFDGLPPSASPSARIVGYLHP